MTTRRQFCKSLDQLPVIIMLPFALISIGITSTDEFKASQQHGQIFCWWWGPNCKTTVKKEEAKVVGSRAQWALLVLLQGWQQWEQAGSCFTSNCHHPSHVAPSLPWQQGQPSFTGPWHWQSKWWRCGCTYIIKIHKNLLLKQYMVTMYHLGN